MSGEKQLLYPNEAGICFGLLPVAVQDGMKAAVANGATCERYDGEKWVPAAFMGKGATLRVVLNPPAPIDPASIIFEATNVGGDKTVWHLEQAAEKKIREIITDQMREVVEQTNIHRRILNKMEESQNSDIAASGTAEKIEEEYIRAIVQKEIAHKPVTIRDDVEAAMRRIARAEVERRTRLNWVATGGRP